MDTRPVSEAQVQYCWALLEILNQSYHMDYNDLKFRAGQANDMSTMSKLIAELKTIVNGMPDAGSYVSF